MRLPYLIALVFAVVVGGCSKGPDLTGTWQSGMGGALTTYHFHKDGKFSMDVLYDACRVEVSGTYALEGGKLALNPSQSKVEGPEPKASELRSQAGQASRVTIRMDSPASFTLMPNDPAPLHINKVSPNP